MHAVSEAANGIRSFSPRANDSAKLLMDRFARSCINPLLPTFSAPNKVGKMRRSPYAGFLALLPELIVGDSGGSASLHHRLLRF